MVLCLRFLAPVIPLVQCVDGFSAFSDACLIVCLCVCVFSVVVFGWLPTQRPHEVVKFHFHTWLGMMGWGGWGAITFIALNTCVMLRN